MGGRITSKEGGLIVNDELIPYGGYSSVSGALDIFIRLVNAFSAVSREIERRRTVSADNMQRLREAIIAEEHSRMLGYAAEMHQRKFIIIRKLYEELESCNGRYQEDLRREISEFSALLNDVIIIDMINEMKRKHR